MQIVQNDTEPDASLVIGFGQPTIPDRVALRVRTELQDERR